MLTLDTRATGDESTVVYWFNVDPCKVECLCFTDPPHPVVAEVAAIETKPFVPLFAQV